MTLSKNKYYFYCFNASCICTSCPYINNDIVSYKCQFNKIYILDNKYDITNLKHNFIVWILVAYVHLVHMPPVFNKIHVFQIDGKVHESLIIAEKVIVIYVCVYLNCITLSAMYYYCYLPHGSVTFWYHRNKNLKSVFSC